MTVTGEDLYEIHRRNVADGDLAELTIWSQLPEWEREEWETLARDQNMKSEYPGEDFDD